MKKIHILASIALAITLSACGGSSPSPQENTSANAPEWVYAAQKSTSTHYYAVGSGKSKKAARLAALDNISSTISVSISSSTQVKKRISNSSYSRSMSQNILASTKKIKFVGTQEVKSAFVNDMFYVKMSVDKNALLKAQIKEAKNIQTKINALYDSSNANGNFYFFSNKNAFDSMMQDFFSRITIAKTINPGFDDKADLDYFNKMNKKLDGKISALSVFVGSSHGQYKEVLQNHLASFGVKITKTAKKNKSAFVVKINIVGKEKKVNTQNPKLRGAKFASVNVNLQTTDSSGKIVAQNSIKLTNISKISYNDALEKGAYFNRYIKKNGLVSTLTGK